MTSSAPTSKHAKTIVSDPVVMAPAGAWEPAGLIPARRRRLIIRLCVLATVLVSYLAGAWYFSGRFTPGTTVDGVDAGLMTTDELADAIQQRTASYEQHITSDQGFELRITGSDISLSSDGTKVAQEAHRRTSPLLWLPYLLAPQHMLIDADISADQEALGAAIQGAVEAYNQNATPPTNASGHYNEESGAFETTPESVGEQLAADSIVEASMIACRELRQDVAIGDEALLQPAITDQDETLLATVQQANKILAQDVNVTSGEEVVATIDKPTMASWMTVTDEQQLDIFGVYYWVEDNEAIKSVGNATDDEHVWALDVQATCDDIHRVMERDQGDDAEVKRTAIETKPAVTPGAKERGRHIDINLTTQFCRFYDSDGKVIWDSYCVSGGWDNEYQEMHSTPTGTFAIQAKVTDTTLVGADRNNDKKPDYESFVNYWMPFLEYDWGLHDATWRSEFGGDIRSWYGSHGCVNLPLDKAEQLFNLVNVGDTVYVHE